MKTYQPYQLTNVCLLGTFKSITNKFTGVSVPTFVKAKEAHYVQLKRTRSQKYSLVGTSLADTIEIVIQHQNLDNIDTVQLNRIDYDISDNSPDDSNEYLTYDILTLKKIEKVGDKSG
ncbi:phage head closure protein [Liquorilactobacillus hordei]|uniref:phage head closure protein n=1 Tax=Liquorilactobacillus hordei TaxID=468911 RepID=UPI0039EA9D9A